MTAVRSVSPTMDCKGRLIDGHFDICLQRNLLVVGRGLSLFPLYSNAELVEPFNDSRVEDVFRDAS